MRYWWVNHKQTARQELSGGYLWSPVTEASGARSRFYDNMRVAGPGDIVLSYAAGQIGRVGIVTDFAMSAPKPSEYGSAGAYWSAFGWLLPVDWLDAGLEVRPKDLLDRLAPLLPETHSPIQPATGNGNQKHIAPENDAPTARGHRPASEWMKGIVDCLFARQNPAPCRCLDRHRQKPSVDRHHCQLHTQAQRSGALLQRRKLAAILVADVVGYSRLAGTDEDRTLSRLRGLRSDLIDPAIDAHHGRLVKRTGDGSLIEGFVRVTAARLRMA